MIPRTSSRRALAGGIALGAGLAALANPFMPPLFWLAVGGSLLWLSRAPKHDSSASPTDTRSGGHLEPSPHDSSVNSPR